MGSYSIATANCPIQLEPPVSADPVTHADLGCVAYRYTIGAE